MWLKLVCKDKIIRDQKDLSKFFKRVIRASNNGVNLLKILNKTRYLYVNNENLPRILHWGLKFLRHLDDVNIQSLSSCLLRLKLSDKSLYTLTCRLATASAYNMEYGRLLSTVLSLSKLHSIYSHENEYLHPLVISASERIITEEISGNHLGLLCQSLYYCKLFSPDLIKIILPITSHFLSVNGLSPENINSIYGYISLYPESGEFIHRARDVFMEYISKSQVDARNIIKFLKINRNDLVLKRISANLLAASVDDLSPNEILDLMSLYTNRDYSSLSILLICIDKLDWIISNVEIGRLSSLVYYICKLYCIESNIVMFRRHLQMGISNSLVNNQILNIVKYIKILERIGGNTRFISNAGKLLNL